jgi:hypothetical protein
MNSGFISKRTPVGFQNSKRKIQTEILELPSLERNGLWKTHIFNRENNSVLDLSEIRSCHTSGPDLIEMYLEKDNFKTSQLQHFKYCCHEHGFCDKIE